VVEAVLLASRAMVSLAEASVRQINDAVTLPQYRTLVLLAAKGPCRLADLADAMGVNPSTATRMCDRLVRKGLIDRARDQLDRREVELSLSSSGKSLVGAVSVRRHALVQGMLGAIPVDERRGLVRALALLTQASGDAPAQHWAAGWSTP
jgi:DNA-binding MarR family transcriptional regulator